MSLQATEERIVRLERAIHGEDYNHNNDNNNNNNDDDISSNDAIGRALRLSQQLGSLEQTHLPGIAQKYQVVRKMLEADVQAKAAMGSKGKMEIIEASEEELRASFKLFSEIEDLKKALDPSKLTGLQTLSNTLQPLEPLHLEQKEALAANSARADALLANYNENVQALSELFLYWDQALTRLEVEVNRKHNDKFN